MILAPLSPGPLASALASITVREGGDWVITIAAVLGGLVAIFTIMNRYVIRPGRVKKQQIEDTWGFAKTGEQRMVRIEGQVSDLTDAHAVMAAALNALADKLQTVATSFETMAAQLEQEMAHAAGIHADLLARDEAIVAQLTVLTTGEHPVTPKETP
jgi:hypothetical protein